MQTGKISVVIPVFNTSKYLSKCIDSVINQTYSNIEIILVNDGSTDNSGDICDEYARSDNRILVIHKKNGGLSSARNAGIERASGEFIGFIDSDDYIDNRMYELLYLALSESKGTIAQIGRDEVGEDGEALERVCRPFGEKVKIPSEKFLEELLMHRGDSSFCTKLMKKELFDRLRFAEGVLNEDFLLLLTLLQNTDYIISLPETGYHIYCRTGSITRTGNKDIMPKSLSDSIHNSDLAEELVHEKFPQLTKVALRFGLFQRLDYMLHIPIRFMRRDNYEYRCVLKYLRKNFFAMLGNKYLTTKNKMYLVLLTIFPGTVRKIHAAKMRRKNNG